MTRKKKRVIITESNNFRKETDMNRSKAGEKLVELRGRKSQSEVANAVGITQAALSMYERGERTPRDDVKIKLANYFGTEVALIFF